MVGFDVEFSPVDSELVQTLGTTAFTDHARNVVPVGQCGQDASSRDRLPQH